MGLDASPVAPPMRPQTMVNSRRHGTIRDQRHYGHVGGLESKSTGPTMEQYFKKAPCPVNIRWHPGNEHYSLGGHDEDGKDPDDYVYQVDDIGARRLAQ